MQRIFHILFILVLVSCAPANPGPAYSVVTHPDGPLYVGDQVSFEVFAPAGQSNGETVTVSLAGQALGSTSFAPYGIGRRDQATLWWAWDTRGLDAGKYKLTFSMSSGYSWSETISLRPAGRLPSPEAQWTSTVTACCNIYYITGTDAARDIEDLAETADRQSEAVAAQMGGALQERVDVTFMPRVIGHGGFAWDGLYISYLDENYAGNEMDILLHHEFVHYYDGWIGGGYRPSIFQEGLATYLSGGHFKPEPIASRAAALLELGWYIPLETLANDFYRQQHDIGYLEAAALVQYLYETYGSGAFNEFYRTIEMPDRKTDAQVIDAALRGNFGLSFADLETAFRSYLATQPVTDDIRTDLELTTRYFDTLRRYQSAFDPSAYFLTAWLPDGRAMRERGIVADFTRRPLGWQNLLVEALLMRAHTELFGADYDSARQTLDWTNRILDWLSP